MAGLIVHEWLEPQGGAEKVVDAMRQAFPDADLLALWNDAPERYPDAMETWLSLTPLGRHKDVALPLGTCVCGQINSWKGGSTYDGIFVGSHLFPQHAKWDFLNRHFSRIVSGHTPARCILALERDLRASSHSRRAVVSLGEMAA